MRRREGLPGCQCGAPNTAPTLGEHAATWPQRHVWCGTVLSQWNCRGVIRATEANSPRILVRGSWLPWEHAGPPPSTCETPKLLLPQSSSWVKFPASCLSVSSGPAEPPTWVAAAASPIDVPWPQECTLFCTKLCAPTVLTVLCDALQLAGIPLRLGSSSSEWSRCLDSGAEP